MNRSINTAHIDLYAVLGVEHNCSREDIENKYVELTKIYHPDNVRLRHKDLVYSIIKKNEKAGIKIPVSALEKLDNNLVHKVQDATKIYNLINQAYEKLTREREQYDFEYNKFQDMESGYDQMKNSSVDFLDSQRTHANDDDYNNKKKLWEQMNKKHGFREDECKISFNEKDMVQRLNDLKSNRSKQDVEDKPEMVFDPLDFSNGPGSMNKFNALFEKMYKSGKQAGEMVEFRDGPQPVGAIDTYCEFDKIDQIYAESDNRLDSFNFSAADFTLGNQKVKITKQDLNNLDDVNYSLKDKPLDQSEIDKRIAEIKSFTQEVEGWKKNDYSTDILHGITPGLEQDSKQVFGSLEFGDEETRKRYKSYLANQVAKKQFLNSKIQRDEVINNSKRDNRDNDEVRNIKMLQQKPKSNSSELTSERLQTQLNPRKNEVPLKNLPKVNKSSGLPLDPRPLGRETINSKPQMNRSLDELMMSRGLDDIRFMNQQNSNRYT
jgi:hypothetical protein